jgi:citronellol/citronellal dehydrogenase
MHTDTSLRGKTAFISGGSRGIGLEIGKRLAAEGANIVIAAKTTEPNPRLPGTIYTAAAEIEACGAAHGSRCLPVQTDIRDEHSVAAAVAAALAAFGGVDILVNNASAISLTPTAQTPIRRFDLMFGVNVRGTYLCTQSLLAPLQASAQRGRNPQVLTLSPPLNMQARWFAPHLAYTMAKYGMSLCVLGHAEELRPLGIAVNALWPRTVIQTAALQMIPGVRPEHCRLPAIMADAAVLVLSRDGADPANSGNFHIDEQVLARAGITDLGRYSVVPGSTELMQDLFL